MATAVKEGLHATYLSGTLSVHQKAGRCLRAGVYQTTPPIPWKDYCPALFGDLARPVPRPKQKQLYRQLLQRLSDVLPPVSQIFTEQRHRGSQPVILPSPGWVCWSSSRWWYRDFHDRRIPQAPIWRGLLHCRTLLVLPLLPWEVASLPRGYFPRTADTDWSLPFRKQDALTCPIPGNLWALSGGFGSERLSVHSPPALPARPPAAFCISGNGKPRIP